VLILDEKRRSGKRLLLLSGRYGAVSGRRRGGLICASENRGNARGSKAIIIWDFGSGTLCTERIRRRIQEGSGPKIEGNP